MDGYIWFFCNERSSSTEIYWANLQFLFSLVVFHLRFCEYVKSSNRNTRKIALGTLASAFLFFDFSKKERYRHVHLSERSSLPANYSRRQKGIAECEKGVRVPKTQLYCELCSKVTLLEIYKPEFFAIFALAYTTFFLVAKCSPFKNKNANFHPKYLRQNHRRWDKFSDLSLGKFKVFDRRFLSAGNLFILTFQAGSHWIIYVRLLRRKLNFFLRIVAAGTSPLSNFYSHELNKQNVKTILSHIIGGIKLIVALFQLEVLRKHLKYYLQWSCQTKECLLFICQELCGKPNRNRRPSCVKRWKPDKFCVCHAHLPNK